MPAIRAFAHRLDDVTTVIDTRVDRTPFPHVQATISSSHLHPDVEALAAEYGFAVDLSETDVRIGDRESTASVRFVPYRVQSTTIE